MSVANKETAQDCTRAERSSDATLATDVAVVVSENEQQIEEEKHHEIEQERALYATLVEKYGGTHEDALFEFCFHKNIPYVASLVNLLLATRTDEVLGQMPQLYIDSVRGDFQYKDIGFFDQLQRENFDHIYKEKLSLSALSEEDKKNRMAVIDILCYDPFKDDAPEDRPQLYRDLTAMLSESMRKDVAKAKAALSIVRGYNNLEKYQRKINELMQGAGADDDTQKTLDQYVKVQKTLQDSINTTAEKNNFTVKGIGNAGKGMLSDVMNQIEEKGIDEGITNFYDIATSKAIEEVANISFKAQLNQINLSKTDYADILTKQVGLVREAQSIARKAQEGIRLAKEKIVKQRLLLELEADYRQKGIDENEIQEFIDREYNLYDGAG